MTDLIRTRNRSKTGRLPIKLAFLLPVAAILLASLAVSGCSPTPTSTPVPTATPTPTPPTPTIPPKPANPDMILATTTSTADSGLLDVLLPLFEKKTSYKVKPIAVGSGQAMTMGQKGEADVLLVHAPDSEVQFLKDGHGINRRLVMHNDFVIVGPAKDAASIKGTKSVVETIKKIAAAQSLFLSRRTNSGTDQAEDKIWKAAGITPKGQSWYQESGQGMGASLTIASEKEAYTIADRATYLATKKNLSLDVLVEGDTLLLNIYHVIQVHPQKSAQINAEGAKAFVEFMVSPEVQQVISKFGIDKYGQPLFFPDAGKKESDLGSV